VVERRTVRSSNGQAEERIVVPLTIRLMGHEVDTDVTLSHRDEMGFRMLIGRSALAQGFLVDSAQSYLGGRPAKSTRRKNWGH
ncbi:MAG: RimK/LysX family protein, partial [Propioniciclava sp.]